MLHHHTVSPATKHPNLEGATRIIQQHAGAQLARPEKPRDHRLGTRPYVRTHLPYLGERFTDVAPDTKPPGHGNAQDPGVKTKLSSTTFKSLWAIPERQSSKPARKTESGSLAAGKGAKKLNEGLSAKKITEGAIPDDGDDMDDSDSSHDSDELDSWGSMDDSDIEDMLSGHNEYEPNLMTTLMNTNFGYKSGEGILPDGTGYEFNFHSDSDW